MACRVGRDWAGVQMRLAGPQPWKRGQVGLPGHLALAGAIFVVAEVERPGLAEHGDPVRPRLSDVCPGHGDPVPGSGLRRGKGPGGQASCGRPGAARVDGHDQVFGSVVGVEVDVDRRDHAASARGERERFRPARAGPADRTLNRVIAEQDIAASGARRRRGSPMGPAWMRAGMGPVWMPTTRSNGATACGETTL